MMLKGKMHEKSNRKNKKERLVVGREQGKLLCHGNLGVRVKFTRIGGFSKGQRN